MVRDILRWEQIKTGTRVVYLGAYQLHEFQNIKTHTDCLCEGSSVPTVGAGLGGLNHNLNVAVPHWSAMAFKSFPKSLKETRGVPDAVVYFLLN